VLTPSGQTPYFVISDRALRDEGTSYHYADPADYAVADPVFAPIGATHGRCFVVM